MDASAETIAHALLGWYDRHARALPWRLPPGALLPLDDPAWPYRVWLSEVMLQQTTVAAAIPYYERFIARWPTVAALAAAEDAAVMAAWAGLGYYARARNLLACARAVAAAGGHFPANEAELRALPGVGAYTAAAVAAIAFGEPAAVVDANVERVVARLGAIAEPLPAARARIRESVADMTPARRPGDFAQAMMDLGARVCTARRPRCGDCPLAGGCAARLREPERFPAKPPRAPRAERQGRAYWIERAGAVWLVRRAPRGMLGGMRALPDDGWTARADGQAPPPLPGPWRDAGSVHHTFSHCELRLQLLLYSGADCDSLGGDAGEWWPLDQLGTAGLPTVFAKAATLALASPAPGSTAPQAGAQAATAVLGENA